MIIMEVASGLAACLLFGVGLLHVYWAFGGRWGGGGVIPQHEGKRAFVAGPGPTLVVAVAVALAGAVLLAEAGITDWGLRSSLIRTLSWICAMAFTLRVIGEFNYFGLFKKRRQTVFARMDTYLYTPLCAFFAASFVWAILH
ncbi:DUF3995 domain-containing protein [Paenibacillus sp. strain BS8-2]